MSDLIARLEQEANVYERTAPKATVSAALRAAAAALRQKDQQIDDALKLAGGWHDEATECRRELAELRAQQPK